MPVISLAPIPAQKVQASLGNQNVSISVYYKSTGLFMDVYKDQVLIIGGVICQNANPIVRDLYLGFQGDFAFYDTAGIDDPDYTQFGTRFFLAYLPQP